METEWRQGPPAQPARGRLQQLQGQAAWPPLEQQGLEGPGPRPLLQVQEQPASERPPV
ncbi:MAG: hypothetical protein ACREI9_14360 [Nitrospiraceae bacterium]